MEGYSVINCIIGGQTLGAVSSHLNATLGIVITGILSLAVRKAARTDGSNSANGSAIV